MQKPDPYCKCISKRLLSSKVPSHEVHTFTHIKGLEACDGFKPKIFGTSYPQVPAFTALIEAHDELGHQGVNWTYHLIKHQYYWKGMNKNIHKYMDNCALYKIEKARTQVYALQMNDIPNRFFDKIAIDLVPDLNISVLGNQHILPSIT